LLFTPDSQRFVVQFVSLRPPLANEIQIRSVQTGETLKRWKIPPRADDREGSQEVTCDFSFSPDGKILASSGTDRIFLWNVADGTLRLRIDAKMGQVKNLAFTPDGKTLVSGSESDGKVHVWDVATGKELRRFDARVWIIRSMALSKDGKTVAVGGVHSVVRLWDLPSGRELFTDDDQGHDAQVNAVAFSPDGKLLASGGENRQLWIWDVASANPLRQFRDAHVSSVSWSPDGRRLVLAGGARFRNKVLRVCDAADGKELLRLSPGDVEYDIGAAFTPDGKTIISADNTWTADRKNVNASLKIWDAASGRQLRSLSVPGMRADCFALSPDGRLAALGGAADEGNVRIWDVQRHKEIARLRGHERPVQALTFSPDGRNLFTIATDQTARLWEIATAPGFLLPAQHRQRAPSGFRCGWTVARRSRRLRGYAGPRFRSARHDPRLGRGDGRGPAAFARAPFGRRRSGVFARRCPARLGTHQQHRASVETAGAAAADAASRRRRDRGALERLGPARRAPGTSRDLEAGRRRRPRDRLHSRSHQAHACPGARAHSQADCRSGERSICRARLGHQGAGSSG
jgi:WD40 repeat protein